MAEAVSEGMFVMVGLDFLRNGALGKVSSGGFKVLMGLRGYVWRKGRCAVTQARRLIEQGYIVAPISVEKLAINLNTHRTTVKRHVDELVSLGWIQQAPGRCAFVLGRKVNGEEHYLINLRNGAFCSEYGHPGMSHFAQAECHILHERNVAKCDTEVEKLEVENNEADGPLASLVKADRVEANDELEVPRDIIPSFPNTTDSEYAPASIMIGGEWATVDQSSTFHRTVGQLALVIPGEDDVAERKSYDQIVAEIREREQKAKQHANEQVLQSSTVKKTEPLPVEPPVEKPWKAPPSEDKNLAGLRAVEQKAKRRANEEVLKASAKREAKVKASGKPPREETPWRAPLETMWSSEYEKLLPDVSQGAWSGKERGQIDTLVKKWGRDVVEIAIRFFLRNFTALSKNVIKGKPTFPTLGLLLAYDASLVPAAQRWHKHKDVLAEATRWYAEHPSDPILPDDLHMRVVAAKAELEKLGL